MKEVKQLVNVSKTFLIMNTALLLATLSWHSAAHAADSPSQFTCTASSSPETVAVHAKSTITASFTNTGAALTNLNVDIEVYGPRGKKDGQQIFTGQDFAAGATNKFSYDFMATDTAGAYNVTLVVVSSDWSKQYFALYPATKFTVNGPKEPEAKPVFSATADVSSATVAPGAKINISTTFKNTGTAVTDALADIEVYDPSGKKAGQKIVQGQDWSAGGANQYVYEFTAPDMVGDYSITLVIENSDWTKQYFTQYFRAKFTVSK